jgi:hypothetical protein
LDTPLNKAQLPFLKSLFPICIAIVIYSFLGKTIFPLGSMWSRKSTQPILMSFYLKSILLLWIFLSEIIRLLHIVNHLETVLLCFYCHGSGLLSIFLKESSIHLASKSVLLKSAVLWCNLLWKNFGLIFIHKSFHRKYLLNLHLLHLLRLHSSIVRELVN